MSNPLDDKTLYTEIAKAITFHCPNCGAGLALGTELSETATEDQTLVAKATRITTIAIQEGAARVYTIEAALHEVQTGESGLNNVNTGEQHQKETDGTEEPDQE